MDECSPRRYCVSSPGKCLITGGYLILEEGNQGLSLALSARYVCDVCVCNSSEHALRLSITSPEINGKWIFSIHGDGDIVIVEYPICSIVNHRQSEENAFVYYSVVEAVQRLGPERACLMGKQIHLILSSHGTFYHSRGDSVSLLSLVYRRWSNLVLDPQLRPWFPSSQSFSWRATQFQSR